MFNILPWHLVSLCYMKNTCVILFTALISLLCGCENNDLSRRPSEGDYLPVNSEARRFLRQQFSTPDELSAEAFAEDEIRIQFVGDTIIGSSTYHQINHFSNWDSGNGIVEVNDYYMFYRKEGSRYLTPSLLPDGEDHVFLDTRKPVGSSWEYTEGHQNEWHTIYTIKDIDAVREVNGIQYQDVIEVVTETEAKDLQGGYYLISSVRTLYAKDLGAIYRFSGSYPYPTGLKITAL
jgi:hypothetical protein